MKHTFYKREYNPLGRNRRTVWTIATQPTPFAHFATFPEALVEPCIRAGTSQRGCCPECQAPWERVVERGELVPDSPEYKPRGTNRGDAFVKNAMTPAGDTQGHPNHHYEMRTTGWQPTCSCDIFGSYLPQPCTVMDPFSGSGTVGKVAIREGRKYIGVDISKDYLEGVTQQRYDGGLQIGMAI